MRTQSIGIQMPNMESASRLGKEKGSNEFDLVLGMNLNGVKKELALSAKETESYFDKGQSSSMKSTDVKAELFQGSKIHQGDQVDASIEADTMVQDTMINSSAEVVDEEEILENISGVIESIMAMLQNVLDVSKEELLSVMDTQQINPEDLVNPEMLQQLLLGLNGESDISLFLTNETLGNQWKELLQNVEEIIGSSDLNLSMEEVEQFLQKMNTEVAEEVVDQVAEEVKVLPIKDEIVTDSMEGEAVVAEEAVDVTISKVDVKTGENRSQDNQQDGFEGIVDRLVQQKTTVEMDGNGNLVQVTQMRDIVNQIVEQIKVIVKPDMTSMTMQLNPEHLGKLELSVQAQNGVLTAQFVVQNEVVKEALESQIHLLKENLNQQGLKVEEIEITVSATPFDQRQEQDTAHQSEGSQRKSKISLEEAFMMDDVSAEDLQEDQHIAGPVGGQIDYNA